MYQVVIEKRAQKQLGQIPEPWYAKIRKALLELANNPRPHGYIKLKGRSAFRIRVGDYRIIYSVRDNNLTVFILLIGNRKDIYDIG